MQKNGKNIKCEMCGKIFYLNKYRLERSKHHFCSKACYDMFEKPHKKDRVKSDYRKIRRKGKTTTEHRYIVENYYGIKLKRNQHVHHINGDKQDNRIENLVIMTPQTHNELHKTKHAKSKICKVCGKEFEPPIKHRARNTICSKECWVKWQRQVSPFKNKQIKQYDLNDNYLRTFSSVKEASIYVNGNAPNIVKCAKGKIKSAYGFKWQY